MKQSRFHFDSGYLHKSRISTAIFNVVTSGVILLLTSPLFVILSVIIKLQDGGPIFYKGERLGKNKKKFTMYKFRTLTPNAEEAIGAKLVSTVGFELVTPVGHFLRETRLDELPQLINILKGDMDILGPRPEREIVYETTCKQIPWYDKRFKVKPGLIGYSQLFTPHSASRKSRALIDNFYLNKKHKMTLDITLLFYACSVLIYKLLSQVIVDSRRVMRKAIFKHSLEEKRHFRRIDRPGTFLKICFKTSDDEKSSSRNHSDYDLITDVVDMNDQHILIKSEQSISNNIERIELSTLYRPMLKYKQRFKSVHCGASVISGRETEEGYFYVIELTELSELNQFKLHKYFLDKSIS